MDPKSLNIIKETVLQISCPSEGLSKQVKYDMRTYDEWIDFFDANIGWVNIGVESIEANIYTRLNVGEVIPNIAPNVDIYKYNFSIKNILSFLGTNNKYNTKRIILNYYSLIKLIKLLNVKDEAFRNQVYLFLKTISAKDFWLNLLISDEKADLLTKKNIGTVLEITDDNMFGRMLNYFDKKLREEDSDIDSEAENMHISEPFIMLLNNHTLKKMFKVACMKGGQVDGKMDVYKYLSKCKNEDIDLNNLFLNLRL